MQTRASEEVSKGSFGPDHYLSVVGRADRSTLDAWVTLAGLAARTSRIRLGTLVSPVTFRHPSVLAKSVATVDHISGGRVELGLGAGWNDGEHAAYGFSFPPLGERMEMLEEQLEVVVRQWADGEAAFEGRHYRLERNTHFPKPVQTPRPPIILGGQAGPKSVSLAVRFADEYNTLLVGVEGCRERARTLRAACEDAGRDPTTLPLSLMATCVVGIDRADLLERVRRVTGVFGSGDDDPAQVLADRSERWIAGTPAEVVERLEALREVGVERVYLQHLLHDDAEMVELVGAEVLPALTG